MVTSWFRHPALRSAAILSAFMLVLSGCHNHHFGRGHGGPSYSDGGHRGGGYHKRGHRGNHGGGHRRGGWRGRY